MKILVIEDRGQTSHHCVETLRSRGYCVYEAGWVYDAIAYCKRCRPDCFIVDLNMLPNGLSASEVEATRDGLLTGWVWLKNYVFARDESARERTLIYTRYVKEFTRDVSEAERAGVAVISKTGEHAASSVLAFVKGVEESLREIGC